MDRYAWFTMNKTVTLTGMEVKTHVGSNLLIQKSSLDATAIEDESGFVTDETQSIKAVLEPVSTVDGKAFYYTLDAAADGSKIHTPVGAASDKTVNFIAYDPSSGATDAAYGNKFSQDYGATKEIVNAFASGTAYADKAVGYVDYVFQLKATNTESTDQSINLTNLELTYKGGAPAEKAYRAAVFISPAVEAGGSFADWSSGISSGTTTNGIYTPSGAQNFSSGTAVNSTTSRGAVQYVTSGDALAVVPTGTVKYYKVVVRLWIEGEDTTCNTSTFKPLTNSWALDLEMRLGEGTAVDNIKLSSGTTN